MARVHEIKFFLKDNKLFVALYDEPSIILPEFWIANIKAEQMGFTILPPNVQLERKYKIKELGLESFEFNKEGLLFGLSDMFNRVTKEFNKRNQTNITNNQFINILNEKHNTRINQGNYNEEIGGNYKEKIGDLRIDRMSDGKIKNIAIEL